jgi:hypothetical protein
MENILSFPKQFGSFDARPEETLRTLETSCSIAQHSLKVLCSLRGTIGQSALRLCPYKLHWIKLRGISGEPFHMKTRIPAKEVMDSFALMDKSPVPQ